MKSLRTGLIALAAGVVAAACGGGGGGGSPPPPPAAELSVVAGDMGGEGSADGVGEAARFDRPTDAAADAAGNVYVADANNNVIRKIDPNGAVSVFAGAAGSVAFFAPGGVAVDTSGVVYVADTRHHTIRRIAPNGTVTTIAGAQDVEGAGDGPGADARFRWPMKIALGPGGVLYVADSNNHTIRAIAADGTVRTVAGSAGSPGSADGIGAAARFTGPQGLAVDAAGTIFVADTGNRLIRAIAPDGTVRTIAGAAGVIGADDGIGVAARFGYPSAIAVDGAALYVADTLNHTIRRIDATGNVTTVAGNAGAAGFADGTGSAARLNGPASISTAPGGGFWIVEDRGHVVRRLDAALRLSTVAGAPARDGSADGRGTAARFYATRGAAVDAAGNLLVVDSYNSTLRKVATDGAVTTLAGSAGSFGADDGGGAAARFEEPHGVAVDAAGNAYVADTFNNTIRKVTSAGVVSTFAGQAGARGSADGAGATARFDSPLGVAIDRTGNLYVADFANHVVRRIGSSGDVTTFAGVAGVQGAADGAASAATFSFPSGVAIDDAGNVYVTDTGNATVRRISPAGIVSTLAGSVNVRAATDGVGPAARFLRPEAIAAAPNGVLYVADANATIRRIAPDGAVTTIVGVAGQRGFAAGPLPGLVAPSGLAVSGTSLYVTMFNGVAVIRNRP